MSENAKNFVADKGYDSEAIRDQVRDKGVTPIIPRRSNSTLDNPEFDSHIYKLRHLVENLCARLKHYRSVAMRFEKLARNFKAIIFIACSLIWMRIGKWGHALGNLDKIQPTTVVFFVDDDVEVFLDGTVIKNPAQGISGIRPGKHTVTLVKPGFKPISEQVIVEKNKKTTINAKRDPWKHLLLQVKMTLLLQHSIRF